MDKESLKQYPNAQTYIEPRSRTQKAAARSRHIEQLPAESKEKQRRDIRQNIVDTAIEIKSLRLDGIISLGKYGEYSLSIENDNDPYGDITQDKCVTLHRTDITVPNDETATKQARTIINLHGAFDSIDTPYLVDAHETIELLYLLILQQDNSAEQ